MHRLPPPALSPWFDLAWHSEEGRDNGREPRPVWETVLPTGRAAIVLRLTGEAIRIRRCGRNGPSQAFGQGVLSGPRFEPFERLSVPGATSMGMRFRAAGFAGWFGVDASVFRDRHFPPGEVGENVEDLREEILLCASPRERLDLLQTWLLEQVGSARRPLLVVERAAEQIETSEAPDIVGRTWAGSGWSRRHFIDTFRREVGATPKEYHRIRRLQRALSRATPGVRGSWISVAHEGGYCDQSHLTRELRAIAGVTPRRYLPRPGRMNHVPIEPA